MNYNILSIYRLFKQATIVAVFLVLSNNIYSQFSPIANDDSGGSIDEDALSPLLIVDISSNDVDFLGNIVPSTAIVVDPDNSGNTGDKDNSLVIPGVGTYVVDEFSNVTFTPVLNFNGDASINYTIEDNDGNLSNVAEIIITVNSVNDVPVVSDIQDQTIDEDGSFATITLDNFVEDVEDADAAISWSFSGNSELSVSIVNRVATITAPANWNGNETITFTATDTDLDFASNDATFTVNSVNDVPVVSDIQDQTIDEDGSFVTITLDNFVEDVEDADAAISWSFSGNSELSVSIVNRVATITAPADWNGNEIITFTATDTDLDFASDEATFTINSVNDIPVVSDIPGETIDEDGIFATISLDNFVEDLEDLDSDITWTYSGNTSLSVSIVDRVATIITPLNWNGNETITFTATDTDLGFASDDATFTVNSVNDDPVVDDIPDQTIDEGESFDQINLNNYVEDVEDVDADINWSYSGNLELTVNINNSNVATITAPNKKWNGSETITFTATDLDGGSDSDVAIFTVNSVNDAPEANNDNIGDIDEDNSLPPYNISNNDIDVDGTVEPGTIVLIDPNNALNTGATGDPLEIIGVGIYTIDVLGNLTFVPEENYYGNADVNYTIEDDLGTISNEATVFINVVSVNDAPISKDDEYIVNEGGTRTLNSEAGILKNDSDPDEDDLEVVLELVTQPKHGTVQVELDGSFVYEHDGSETTLDSFSYVASDGVIDGNLARARINILPVNDPPYFQSFSQITRYEGPDTTFKVLSDFAIDDDSPSEDLTFSIGSPSANNINAFISQDTLYIATVDSNWFGSEDIYILINDNDSEDPQVTKDTILVNVTNIDDAPQFTVDTIHVLPTNEDEGINPVNLNTETGIIELDGDELVLKIPDDPIFSFTNTNYLIQATVPEHWNGERYFEFYIKDKNTAQKLSDVIILHYKIKSVDDAPEVENPINNISVLEDADDIVYNLHNVFNDIDNSEEDMEFEVYNSKENIIDAFINDDDELIIRMLKDKNFNYGGAATVNVSCTSNGKSVNNAPFNVTVTPVNDPPTFVVSGDVIIFGNEQQHSRQVTVVPDPVPIDESSIVTYSLSPSSVDFADVSINEYFGHVSITVPIGAEGYQEFTIIANDNVHIAMQKFQLSVNVKSEQTIIFNSIPDKTLSDSIVILEATASSGLPVSFSVVGGLASVSNDTLTILGAGQIVVRASQAGNQFYKPASDVDRSFSIEKLYQEITFEELPDKTYGDDNFVLNATSSSGLDISYDVEYGPVYLLHDSIIQINGVGETKVVAYQNGNAEYGVADTVAHVFEIKKANQSIQFNALNSQTYSSTPISLSATSSSALPVSFAVLSGSAYIQGSSLYVTGSGYITIRALQNGNSNYNPAEDVDQTIEIYKASQSITLDPISDTTFGSFIIELNASTSSGLDPEFIIEGPVEINNTTLSINGTGSVLVSAYHPGDDRYLPTDTITRSFEIKKAVQFIDLDQPPSIVYDIEGIVISATVSSGLDLSLEIVSGPATAEGNVIEPYDYGEVEFRVTQEGNENYKSAALDYTITFVESLYDISMDVLLFPSKDEIVIDRLVIIEVRIKNTGNREIESFNIFYSVDNENNNDIIVSEYYPSSLYAGDSIDYSFGSPWTPRETNNELCVYLQSENDGNPTNDTICLPLSTSSVPLAYNDGLIENVYPNPANDFVYFSMGKNVRDGRLIIYNTTGAVVEQFDINSGASKLIFEVDVNKYRQGTYYYRYINNREYSSGKFVVY